MAKVNQEQAAKEVENWLNYKKVSNKEKDVNADTIEQLADAVSGGILSLDPKEFVFKHKLLFPVGNEEITKEISYKPRLNDRMLVTHLKGVKSNDADGRLTAYICALTDQPKHIIKELDTADKKISMAIAIFFL